jgi:Rv0078B-related antitoxin
MTDEARERERIAALAREMYLEEIERARRMTPEQKLRAGAELFDFASKATLAGIRQQNPDASEEEVRQILRQRLDWARERERSL